MKDLTVLILAAGKGTRMKSDQAKVLHTVGGLPMLEHVVRAARLVSDDISVVIGHQASTVQEAVQGVSFVMQDEQHGTGHAVMAARNVLIDRGGDLLVLPGDVPLIRPDTLTAFCEFHRDGAFDASVLTASIDDPTGYGRVVRREQREVDSIIEHRDADSEVLGIREINSGIYLFDVALLFDSLDQTRTENAQKEYYLTDVVGILTGGSHRVGAFEVQDVVEASGINSRRELAEADRVMRNRKNDELMDSGVSILDPASARIDTDVRIGTDSVIHPFVTIEGSSTLANEVTVRSHSRITNSSVGSRTTILDGSVIADSEIGDDVSVGPRAHLRMGAVLENRVKVGNFVEVKKSRLGEGSKAMHLAYIGDATIGKNVNVGAGVITCNYDGVNKHQTIIEDNVFVGSDSQLIAPVRIGQGAYVAAGSTISEDVPADALAIGRGRQVVKDDWAKKRKKGQ